MLLKNGKPAEKIKTRKAAAKQRSEISASSFRSVTAADSPNFSIETRVSALNGRLDHVTSQRSRRWEKMCSAVPGRITPCPGRPTSTGDHKEKETKTTKNEKISPKIPNAFVFLRYLLFKTNSGTAPQAQVPAGCRMPEVTPTITTKRRSNLTASLTCLKRNSEAPVRLRSRQAGALQNVYDDLYFTEQPYGLV